MANATYDAVIVGASLAGCATAIHLARRGAQVALVERDANPAAFKKLCTHSIHSSALPAIERLGLREPLEAAGAMPIELEIWTRWGWIRDPWPPRDRPAHGYNLRRERLDPLVREIASGTPGVHVLRNVEMRGGRPVGVTLERPDGEMIDLAFSLLVGADGRHSPTAKAAGVRETVKRHDRFAYYAHYRDTPMRSGSTCQTWFMDPDWAGAFATDDGVVIAGVMLPKSKLADWKQDLWGNLERRFASLADAPDLTAGRRASPMMGMFDMPCISRPAARPGLALVGDAALAADPLWGVGCGFAFEAAEWLADSVAAPLAGDGDLDAGLRAYAKRHKAKLGGHAFLMADYASGRRFNAIETLMYSGAARDPACAATLLAFGTRNIGPGEFLSPPSLARSAAANLAHRPGRGRAPGRVFPPAIGAGHGLGDRADAGDQLVGLQAAAAGRTSGEAPAAE
jgi:2-polyprenyl-6-methoxyphenol hydroxylase-like FAD-dependent oxidoreductase